MPEFSLEEMRAAAFHIFTQVPAVAQQMKKWAEQDGVPFEAVVLRCIANGYQRQGQPVPPDVRHELMEQTKNVAPASRARFLKAHLS